MSFMTAASVLDQIYRELEVSIAAGTHYYSGVFTVDKIAYYWNLAQLSVQPFIVQGDLDVLVRRVSGAAISSGLVARPLDFHAMLAAKIGTSELHVDSPGSGLDKIAWRDSSFIPTERASISAYSRTQFVIRGNYDTSGTLDYIYMRKPHAPALVARMEFDEAGDTAELSAGGNLSLYEDFFAGGVLFNVTDSLKYTIESNTLTVIKVAEDIVADAFGKIGVAFSLPEIQDEYIDAMVAKTCLLLCNGEDRNGWRERFSAPKMMGVVNVDPGPRVVQQSLWGSFD